MPGCADEATFLRKRTRTIHVSFIAFQVSRHRFHLHHHINVDQSAASCSGAGHALTRYYSVYLKYVELFSLAMQDMLM